MPVLQNGELVLYGFVGASYYDEGFTAKDVLYALAEVGRDTDITVRINSPGGYTDDGIFDPNLQDRLGYHLLKRRGYEEFMAGNIDRMEFGKRLAQEWASFPVLAAVRGAHRIVKRGETYYAGDALNKALVTPAKIETLLDRVKATGDAVAPVAEAQPSSPQAMSGFWASLCATVLMYFGKGK
ncbi:hypothetical protein [Brucella inopinata]|uniref:hypothetical protein n=1 Tax=Brucella inopinata TaxID=1218315 RepID=UPI000870D2A3|nr:hypothetical protein [Brucella inopinata]SCD25513.1 hypothetical protein BR141012304_21054 [Brucella inopinata]